MTEPTVTLTPEQVYLNTAITLKKKTAFVKGYQATDEEALGMLIAKHFQWDGLAILKTLYYALEDANFHTENETIQTMIDRIEDKRQVNDAIKPKQVTAPDWLELGSIKAGHCQICGRMVEDAKMVWYESKRNLISTSPEDMDFSEGGVDFEVGIDCIKKLGL